MYFNFYVLENDKSSSPVVIFKIYLLSPVIILLCCFTSELTSPHKTVFCYALPALLLLSPWSPVTSVLLHSV